MHQRAYMKGGFNWSMPPPKSQSGKGNSGSPCCDRLSNPLFFLIFVLSAFLAVSAGVLSLSEYWTGEMVQGSACLPCGTLGGLTRDWNEGTPKGWEFFKDARVLLVSHELSFSEPAQQLMELAALLVKAEARVTWVTNQKETHGEHLEVEQRLEAKLMAMKVGVMDAKSEEISKVLTSADTVVLNSILASRFLDSIQTPELLHAVLKKTAWWLQDQKLQYVQQALLRHLPEAAAVIVESKAAKEFWRQAVTTSISKDLLRVHVVPPGLSREVAELADTPVACRHLSQFVRSTVNLDESAFVVSIIGASTRAAGQDLFLRAFKSAVDTCQADGSSLGGPLQALLVGSNWEDQPKLETELRQLVKTSGLLTAVAFVNQTKDIVPYLAASNVLVQNGQAQGEVSLRTVVSAMALRLPVLAAAIPDSMEIVTNNSNGILHPVGKEGVPVLAATIAELALDRKMLSNVGRRGFEKVRETYLESHFVERMGKILKGVYDAKGQAELVKKMKRKKQVRLVTEVVR